VLEVYGFAAPEAIAALPLQVMTAVISLIFQRSNMTRSKKDFYAKTLLMLGLAAAIVGVAHAGYDADELPAHDSQSANVSQMNESEEMMAADRQMLIRTLSEEFTEIQSLASQQVKFREMNTTEGTQIARMYGRWIREHKAGVPGLAYLIRKHDGDPNEAKELKAPVLGTMMEMLHATAMAHHAAVKTSQQRFGATRDWDVRWAMNKRADVARKHLSELMKYHNPNNCPMCRDMMQGKM
jgi:hypothetical protein